MVSSPTILKERLTCLVEQTLFEVDHAGVLDIFLRKTRGVRQVLRRQNALLAKSLQIDEKGVACEC
jgi:hypothetical protein